MSEFDPNRDEINGGLSPAETYDTIRLKIIYEIKDEVIGLIKKHFAWMALVLLTSGFAGPTLFMKEYISAAIDKDVDEARFTTALAVAATKEAVTATQAATAGADQAQVAISDTVTALLLLQDQADEISNKFENLRGEIAARSELASERTDQLVDPLKVQIAELNTRVQVLLNRVTPRTAADFETEQKSIGQAADLKIQAFQSKSGFEIEFIVSSDHAHPEVDAAIKELRALGYPAKTTKIKPGAKNAPASALLDQLASEQWLVLTPPGAEANTAELTDLLSRLEFDTVVKPTRQPGVYKVIHADWAEDHQRAIQEFLRLRPTQRRLPGGD